MNPVTILLVEDGLGDAELIRHALERGGLAIYNHLASRGIGKPEVASKDS